MTKIVTCAAPIAAVPFKVGLKSLFKQAAIFSVTLLALIEISSPLRAMETAPTPSGPAAQAILRWFTTDRSRECSMEAPCAVEDANGFEVYYGDSTGGGPQADALAFAYYSNRDGGNGTYLTVAYFHRDGGNYRFIKTFPDIGDLAITPKSLVKGTTVRFLPGKARFSMVVLGDRDAACCPTGRANYTVTLNPFALPTTYHAPQTAAELALDHVLNLDMTAAPENLSHLMATNTLPAQYAALFTPALSLAVFNANTAEVQQNCNGKPQTENGLICDLHFDVLLCEPDVPPTPILYRTISGNGNKATVAFEWGTEGTDHGRYRLVKVDGTWKLDGVNCIFPPPVGSITFNWHAGTVSDKFNVSQSVPQFAQFPSPAYRGPIGRVDLSSPNVYQYRTRLQNGARQPPNFAGHYQLVQWGCGTECNTGAVIDALNGQVTFLPTVAMQGMEAAMDAKFKAVEFRADSRLIVFSGRINETGVLGTHFDLWNGSGFQELLTVPFVPPATQAQQQPVGGGTLLSHKAASQEATSLPPGISPGLIQSWKDYIRDYPTKLAEYQKDQAAHRKEAKEIDFSEVKNMDDVEKSHPFLHEEFQKIRDDQKMEMAQDKTYSEDLSKIYIAESRGKINLLFVKSTGRFYCGSHGCNTTVYADEGTGYKKAMDAITGDSVYVTRTGGELSYPLIF